MRRAELLLDESTLRRLVDQLEEQLTQAVAAHGGGAGTDGHCGLVAAGTDTGHPDLPVRTVLCYSLPATEAAVRAAVLAVQSCGTRVASAA